MAEVIERMKRARERRFRVSVEEILAARHEGHTDGICLEAPAGVHAMTTVSSYEAKTHLPRLIRAAERGETVIITRHGKPVAQLGPVQDQHGQDVAEVMKRMATLRRRLPKVSIEEILAWRHEGHKY